ncbi:MAG: dimethylarginine dimethylaminohydrolase family protein [Anaerolineae bacterium]
MSDLSDIAAAYGGPGWSPRTDTTCQEMHRLWGPWGMASEWAPLRAVLLHRPGPEIKEVPDPNAVQMLAPVDPKRMRQEHDALAEAYRSAGITVHYLEPATTPPPNTVFLRDLFFMTPEGAILARPASTVRAGEEVHVARRLADLGVPILRSVRGAGTFEGADALWVDERTTLLTTGLRTNDEGAAQVQSLLEEMGVEVVRVDLPYGTMHLLGTVNFADRDLAVAWPGRVPHKVVKLLHVRGFETLWLPDEKEARQGMALNFVTLGPRRVLMPAGSPCTRAVYQAAGIECIEVEIGELIKAAGGMGCLTGVLSREQT